MLKPFRIKAFDWDKEFYAKWSQFDYDPIVERGIRDSTNDLFSKRMTEALDKKQNFAFETNFHQDSIFRITSRFKSAGFQLNLYFFLISHIDICKIRVENRVKIDHGHPVGERTIEERFIHGLNNLDRSIDSFERLFLYDASFNYDVKRIAVIQKATLVQKISDLPALLKYKLPTIGGILGN